MAVGAEDAAEAEATAGVEGDAVGKQSGAGGGGEEVVAHGWRRRRHVTEPVNREGRGAGKLALVFGREVEGLTDHEVSPESSPTDPNRLETLDPRPEILYPIFRL